MKKLLILIITTIFICCSPKEEQKRVSLIELQIIPSFWFRKKFVVNVKEKYLLYKNLSVFADEDGWPLRGASENSLIPLTDKEVDSLVILYDKIVISEEEVPAIPDGESVSIQAVGNDKKLTSIYNGDGIGNLRRAMVQLVQKKSKDPKVQKETSRL